MNFEFYICLDETEVAEHKVLTVEIKTFWETAWRNRQNENNESDMDKYRAVFLFVDMPLYISYI